MSLRAKIEAVVYAAEEPVTLAQMAAVFGAEVRELRQAEAAAAQDATQQDSAPPAEQPSPEEVTSDQVPAEEAAAEVPLPAEDGNDPGETASPAPNDSDAAERRAVRQEERAIREYLKRVLDELMAELQAGDRGIEIREIAGGYRMATKPEYHDAIRAFVRSLKPPLKLSLQALETLAVIAYKQPVTGPEISEIRGVESAGVLGSLIARKLITTAGRKQVIGRPILYKTTREFLLRFGLKDLNELPSIEEFEKMAGELAEPDLEPVAEPELFTEAAVGEKSDTLPDSTQLQQESTPASEPEAAAETVEEKAGEA